MKSKIRSILIFAVRILPVSLCAALIILYFLFGRNIDVQTVLSYTPVSRPLAAAFLIVLYALKSMSIFFPIVILYFAGGFIFPTWVAILVNTAGAAVALAVAYGVGRISGGSLVEKFEDKYPKVAYILSAWSANPTFAAFFLRIISCLPGDAVSMLLGARKMPFGKYITGSILGYLPGLIASTLVGASITDPSSPMFLVSVSITVLISAGSMLFYYLWKRKRN